MTQCEKRGWKVGDRFRVTGCSDPAHMFSVGEIVTLSWIPETAFYSPKFRLGKTGIEQFVSMHDVEPLGGLEDGRPPVGTHCEARYMMKHGWLECVVLPDNKGSVKNNGDWFTVDFGSDPEFRPLRSDRERAIDEMAEVVASDSMIFSSTKGIAERLYDAGYRKTEPSE